MDTETKIRFAEDFLRIAAKAPESGKSSLIVPLRFNKTQRMYLEGKTFRNAVLKARQLGTSTVILSDFFMDAITIEGLSAAVISYASFQTSQLLEKVHLFHSLCPVPNFFPRLFHNSDHLMSFPTPNSSFFIDTARARVVQRGTTIHRCHLSEFAFYEPERKDEIFAEVGQSVPMTGVLTVESTPHVRGDSFFNLYFGAKEGDNNFKSFFFPWWLASDYILGSKNATEGDRDENLELTIEENVLIGAFHLTNDQIRWRRYKIRELGHKFKREYPEDDQSCWLNPEAMVFSIEAIDRLLVLGQTMPPIDFRPAEQAHIWEYSSGRELYVIGADPAEGLATSDDSASSVVKVGSPALEVAAMRGKIPIDVFARNLASQGREYNNALIAVENSPHGIGVLSHLRALGYNHTFWSRDEHGKPKKEGWTTSLVTRPQMIDRFDLALRSGSFRSYNPTLLGQCQGFVMEKGRPQAPKGEHDDALFAAMIAVSVLPEASPYSVESPLAVSYLPF